MTRDFCTIGSTNKVLNGSKQHQMSSLDCKLEENCGIQGKCGRDIQPEVSSGESDTQ